MGKFVPKIQEQILRRLVSKTVARSELSDLSKTSISFGMLTATAREIDDAYFQIGNLLSFFNIDRAKGVDLDARARDYPSSIERIPAVKATGHLVFERAAPGASPVTIPIGTRIAVPDSDIVAVTTAAGTILALSATSAPVAATMEAAGTAGNVAADQLTSFKSARPAGVDTVSNPSGFTGGADEELDDAFRERIRNHVRTLSRCTPQAIEYVASTVELNSGQRVIFSKVVEDAINLGKFYVYVDDGAGTAETTEDNTGDAEVLTTGVEFPGDVAQGGEEYLYTDNYPIKESASITVTKNGVTPLVRDDPGANGYTLNAANGQIFLNTPLVAGDDVEIEYTWYTGLIAEVQKVIDGDAADRTNYPGWRAAGTQALVRTPQIVTLTIEGDVTVRDGYNQATVAAEVKTVLAAYVNALGIGADIIRAEMIERAMAVEGMYDFTLSAPAANVPLLDNQLPRTDPDVNITLN